MLIGVSAPTVLLSFLDVEAGKGKGEGGRGRRGGLGKIGFGCLLIAGVYLMLGLWGLL